MDKKYDVIVIGGGVAGLSTAYFLSRKNRLSVAVIEQEKNFGGHASGRNAGMLRQALADPVLAELAVKSRRYFDRAQKEGWRSLDLRPNGSLLLCRDKEVKELGAIESSLDSLGQSYKRFSKDLCVKKVPLLAGGRFDHALFCPKDALVDIEALLGGFLYNLKKRGVSVLRGRRLTGLSKTKVGFTVHCGSERFIAGKVVNAAGAWTGWGAEHAGAQNVPLTAYRRHLYFSSTIHYPQSTIHQWPFVWDLSHDLYFRPVGRRLLISPCDKTPEKLGDRKEKVDPTMKTALYEKMKQFKGALAGLRVVEAISGLRTMSPDGRFVIGEDKYLKGFYWAAGLGGHGVTTCFSVGELAADLVLGKKTDARMTKALSPRRFDAS